MVQIRPGDLLAIAHDGRYYYALVLDRIGLFGGNFSFAFHRTSEAILAADEVLCGPRAGFHAFVDFIWAKRQNRIVRLAASVGTRPFAGPGFLKQSNDTTGKARHWYIIGMDHQEIRRTKRLSARECSYPLEERIDDFIMKDRVDARWTPAADPRI